jgi:LuxR family maltose regulon positive regulatory protein
MLATQARALVILTLVRMGQADHAEQVYADINEREHATAEMLVALAGLRLAAGDPDGATAALAPALDGSAAARNRRVWLLIALTIEAAARDALGDARAADHAVQRALDIAEDDGRLLLFMVQPVPKLLERHRRLRTSHASLVSDILSLLAGHRPSPAAQSQPLREALTESETRVLRYLPTNLSAPEIAGELYLAVSTVKTHIRHVYAKLGVHRRAEAVERARSLGLLAPTALKVR